jgi:hypothetical protein
MHWPALFAWWLHEMHEVVADLGERLAPGRPYRTMITFDENVGNVVQSWRNGTSRAAQFSRTADGDWPRDRREFWPETTSEHPAVHVLLRPSAILMRRLRLPAGAAGDLMPIVELQLERELPLARDQVHVDWRVESRDREHIEVTIVIVRRAELESMHELMDRWRLRVLTIGVAASDTPGAFDLGRQRKRRFGVALARVDKLMALSAATLLIAYACVTGAQWLHERMVVEEELAGIREAASRVERLLTELQERSRPVAQLEQLMGGESGAHILAMLSSALPADSWLPELDIRCADDGTCSIKAIAITPVATRLLDGLQKLPSLAGTQLHSSHAAQADSGRDRVEISAQWVAAR